jgi:hypothetical protein
MRVVDAFPHFLPVERTVVHFFLSKVLSFLVVSPVSRSMPDRLMSTMGLILFETPCYFITTCYSLTLLGWLSISMNSMSVEYQHFGAKGRTTVLFENGFVFVVNLILTGKNFGPSTFQSIFNVSVNVFRDALMAADTFFVFLRCEFGISQFANESSRGRRLFIVNLELAVVLIQGIGFQKGREIEIGGVAFSRILAQFFRRLELRD